MLRGGNKCPRCKGTVSTNDDFPQCLHCGWEDYNNPTRSVRAIAQSKARLAWLIRLMKSISLLLSILSQHLRY
jgi:hypothetical protein